MKKIILLVTVIVCHVSLYAQVYKLDSTWNNTGINKFNYFNKIDRGYSCTLLPDQRLLMAGLGQNSANYFEIAVSRFLPNGKLDTTFSGDGISYVSMGQQQSIGGQTPYIKVDVQGNIYVGNAGNAGNFDLDMLICKMDSNGVLDNNFDSDGRLFIDMTGTSTYPDLIQALDFDASGNLYLIGATRNGPSPFDNDFAVVKISPTGVLDPTFDSDGKKLFNPTGIFEMGRGIRVLPSGNIVAAGVSGSNWLMISFDSTGVLDPSFGNNGVATITIGNGGEMMAMDLDKLGRIVMCGNVSSGNGDMAVARYLNDGTPDTSFSGDGKYTFDIGGNDNGANTLVINDDHSIFLGGYCSGGLQNDFTIAKVSSAGVLDLTFNNTGFYKKEVVSGVYEENVNGMAVGINGRIYLSGTVIFSAAVNEDVAIMCLTPDTGSSSSVAELVANVKASLFPSPANQFITIQSSESILGIEIVSNTGSIAISKIEIEDKKATADVNALLPGNYVAIIKTRYGNISKPFVVLR